MKPRSIPYQTQNPPAAAAPRLAAKRPTLEHEIYFALETLANSPPHMHKAARFTMQEIRIYREAYYWAVHYALRVTVEAVERHKGTAKWFKRERTNKKRA